MRFILNRVSSSNVRLGQITDLPRLPGKLLETPLLLLYTRGASIPHITREVFQYLTKEQQCILINLPTSVQTFDSLQEYKEGIGKFCGLEECISYCSVQDPGTKTPEGYNTKNEISVWSYAGRVTLTPDKYMKMMEAFKPDMYETIGDSDTNMESSLKRCRKSVEVSAAMFSTCMERHKASSVLKGRGIIANVEGGHDLNCRRRSAEFVAKDPDVAGFTINGLHNNGPHITETDFTKIKHIVLETLKCLPEDKVRVVGGCWKPQQVLELLQLGIDIFDSSLPYIVTQRNSALTFTYKSVDAKNKETQEDNTSDAQLEMSLENTKLAEEFVPLVEGCTCLACTKHTRAYIHHLINVKELLASTLLMIHNLHHYIEFFKFIRTESAKNRKVVIS